MESASTGDREGRGGGIILAALALNLILLGATIELLVVFSTGTSEAWDHPSYWLLGYPGLGLLAGISGYLVPRGVWRWPALLLAGQFLSVFVRNPTGSLLPLGVLFVGVLALPLLLPAYLGRWLARRRGIPGSESRSTPG